VVDLGTGAGVSRHDCKGERVQKRDRKGCINNFTTHPLGGGDGMLIYWEKGQGDFRSNLLNQGGKSHNRL